MRRFWAVAAGAWAICRHLWHKGLAGWAGRARVCPVQRGVAPMPKLVRLYIQSAAIGFALACGFVVALMALDIAGLRGLIFGSEIGWIAAGMLIVFNGIIFRGRNSPLP